jgi:hypothetical protein
MKNLKIVSILAFFLVLTACASSLENANEGDATNETEKFKNYFRAETENFRINFPAKPTRNAEIVTVDGLQTEIIDYTLSLDSYVYTVAISPQNTTNIATEDDYTQLLISLKDGFCTDMQLIVEEEKALRLNGNRGIFFKANSAKYYCAVVNYIVKDKVYQIAILTSTGKIEQKKMDDFLFTFGLLKEK